MSHEPCPALLIHISFRQIFSRHQPFHTHTKDRISIPCRHRARDLGMAMASARSLTERVCAGPRPRPAQQPHGAIDMTCMRQPIPVSARSGLCCAATGDARSHIHLAILLEGLWKAADPGLFALFCGRHRKPSHARRPWPARLAPAVARPICSYPISGQEKRA